MPVGSLRLIFPLISAIVAGALVAAACGGGDDPQPLTEPLPDASAPSEQPPAVDDQAAADPPQQDDQPDEPAAPAEDDTALEEPEEPTAVGTYTVQTGDNLSSIAVQFNTSIDEIVALNNLDNPNALSVGQVLRIPGGDFPEDEETVADTPEEQEQPEDDEPSEPPPDEETEATPDPSPSVTGLSPEGIPQPGPDVVTDQLPTQPGQFGSYATTTLPWLHGNTEVDEILEIILAWSMP
ncbi:MAG: LysM peptidoglycan-binding domain-containing protein, partial [Chloroflexi bacterium]|nr:LysM peptidoglycan-binding domain-containing protein [Chloroflexota bacterium]